MNKTLFFITILTSLIVISCNNQNQTEETNLSAEIIETTPELNTDSIVNFIDELRKNSEINETTSFELPTKDLREKIKQKWSKIHFYLDAEGVQVIKIKTYPHEGISKRTEEFYANNSQLALVVIEDDGTGEKGKSKENIDKMYYFHNGELVKELKNNTESEFNIKSSDAEELLSEFNEYLEIYSSTKK